MLRQTKKAWQYGIISKEEAIEKVQKEMNVSYKQAELYLWGCKHVSVAATGNEAKCQECGVALTRQFVNGEYVYEEKK